jgi:hypothetical protein
MTEWAALERFQAWENRRHRTRTMAPLKPVGLSHAQEVDADASPLNSIRLTVLPGPIGQRGIAR